MGMAVTCQPHATRRFTADEVWRMVEIGLLDPDEPYELINWELLYVSPQNPPHAKVITRLNMALAAVYGPRDSVVRVKHPIGGIVDSIPEPDLAVVTLAVEEQERHPRADETLLIVEVSDTSVARDVSKGGIYATAGAPLYWRVDVTRRVVVVHRGPVADGTWSDVAAVAIDETLDLPGIEGTLEVVRILAPPA